MRLRASKNAFTRCLAIRDKKTGKILVRCRTLDGHQNGLEQELLEMMIVEIELQIGTMTQKEKEFVATELHHWIWK